MFLLLLVILLFFLLLPPLSLLENDDVRCGHVAGEFGDQRLVGRCR